MNAAFFASRGIAAAMTVTLRRRREPPSRPRQTASERLGVAQQLRVLLVATLERAA
jgi:hypothetical protein